MLPHRCEWVWAAEMPVSTTATAPAMPSARPATLSFVKRSIPNNTETTSTSSGTIVSMIDPSMGDVIESPYMMKTPISLRMSVRATFSDFSQASGMSESSAVAISEPDTMAIGWTYSGSTML